MADPVLTGATRTTRRKLLRNETSRTRVRLVSVEPNKKPGAERGAAPGLGPKSCATDWQDVGYGQRSIQGQVQEVTLFYAVTVTEPELKPH